MQMSRYTIVTNITFLTCGSYSHEISIVTQRLLESGPVKTAGYDSLSLLAEQVSHHPPGMYACACTHVHSHIHKDAVKWCAQLCVELY